MARVYLEWKDGKGSCRQSELAQSIPTKMQDKALVTIAEAVAKRNKLLLGKRDGCIIPLREPGQAIPFGAIILEPSATTVPDTPDPKQPLRKPA